MESPTNNGAEPLPSALGRYQIQEELGRGAMGAVYKAFDPVIARTVALKTILIDHRAPDRAQMIERLKQEAKAAGGLDHPNIITIYDVGDESGAVYLSMQYVQGTTLASLLEDVGVPALATLLSWADQISAAVGFAHARGVIHRDLKPANLMVTDQGTIKVLDFGIAKIENTSLTQTGLVFGTPAYMSPEQIAGKKIDHRSDIFSLGAVFYELMTREKAFSGDIATILYKIVNEHPIAPSIVNPAIPGNIDAVVRKALAKDPKDRFQTCEEMQQAFAEQSVRGALAAAAMVPAKKSVGNSQPAASARRVPQPSRFWSTLMLGSAVLLIAAAGWAFYVRSLTGDFPPLVTKLENRVKALHPGHGDGRESAAPVARPAIAPPAVAAVAPTADEHGAVSTASQNADTASAPVTATQTPAALEASNPAAVATLQPVAGQSSSDKAATEGTPVSGTPAPSSTADISQKPADSKKPLDPSKPVDPSQPASAQTAESSDSNQPASGKPAPGKAAAHGAATAAVSSRRNQKQDDKEDEQRDEMQSESATVRPPARKRTPESVSTVDGFTRSDVPDLLRQADSYAARGENRLARYEYGIVLRLERDNPRAREGLRRLQAIWQSR